MKKLLHQDYKPRHLYFTGELYLVFMQSYKSQYSIKPHQRYTKCSLSIYVLPEVSKKMHFKTAKEGKIVRQKCGLSM